MNDDVLVPMLYHIEMQCQIVLESNRDLERALAAYDAEFAAMVASAANPDKEWRPLSPGGTTTAYRHLQSLLVAAANISKALWGVKVKRRDLPKEREPLRKVLGVTDQSVLVSRTVRDCFEHYDERVVEWIAAHPGTGFGDCNIGPGHPGGRVFRHYDPLTKVVTGVDQYFKEFTLSVADVVAEVQRIVAANPCAYKPLPAVRSLGRKKS